MLSAIGFRSSIKHRGADALVRPVAQSAAGPRRFLRALLARPGRGVRGHVIVGAPYQPTFRPLSCSSSHSIIGRS